MHHARYLLVASLIALLACSSGCIFSRARKDKRVLESLGTAQGSIKVTDWKGAPIILAWSRLPATGDIMVVQTRMLTEPQDFVVRLEPGTWLFGAFEDANSNSRHDDGERGAVSEPIDLRASQESNNISLVVSEEFDRGQISDYTPIREHRFSVGDVVPLEDPRFSVEIAAKGLWQPVAYALENRPGIYMLEPFDETRTPVLFVHGMGGYGQEFASLIDRLDRSRFQPWIFSYPSGYPLQPIAGFLHSAIVELETKHDVDTLCVVAHSMGGLVARGFLGIHLEGERDQSVRTLVTMASPLGGLPSASVGARFAPEVVRAWVDLAPRSDFLASLYDPPLGTDVEYHLLFSYVKSGSSDGVVPITSQLRDAAQAEAEVVRGFSTSHAGILTDDAPAAQVLAALDRCRGDIETRRVGPRPLE